MAYLSLSAEAFNDIVNSLKSDNGGRSNEQRARPRVGVRGRFTLTPLGKDGREGKPFDVWVRDLSADGMGVLHTEPLNSGDRVIARFKRNNEAPLTLIYVVSHCKSVTKGLFTVGAHLLSIDEQGLT